MPVIMIATQQVICCSTLPCCMLIFMIATQQVKDVLKAPLWRSKKRRAKREAAKSYIGDAEALKGELISLSCRKGIFMQKSGHASWFETVPVFINMLVLQGSVLAEASALLTTSCKTLELLFEAASLVALRSVPHISSCLNIIVVCCLFLHSEFGKA